jgi:3-methylfumaryl-CoA hydratase
MVVDQTIQREAPAIPERRTEICALSLGHRIAAMLDIDAEFISNGTPLPRGWHFPILAGETRRSELRGDGFPGFGLPMPDLGLPRLMLLGRTVDYISAIPFGSQVSRHSTLDKLQHKDTASGPAALVTLRHQLHVSSSPEAALVETQTYMLLGPTRKPSTATVAQTAPEFEFSKVITPDETLLFQYSALGFNSHKIHIDRTYAREIEGLPDLVVNGGLITLLLTEFLRTKMAYHPQRIVTKHKSPLYCGRPIRIGANRVGNKIQLLALDELGTIATEMEALIHEL